jgi:hypothetical protein
MGLPSMSGLLFGPNGHYDGGHLTLIPAIVMADNSDYGAKAGKPANDAALSLSAGCPKETKGTHVRQRTTLLR